MDLACTLMQMAIDMKDSGKMAGNTDKGSMSTSIKGFDIGVIIMGPPCINREYTLEPQSKY